MLTEMDKRLIIKEEKRFPSIDKLLPLLDESNPVKNIEELFKNYQVHEITQHWYDGGPRFMRIQCDLCEDKDCDNCKIWHEWVGSEEQLSYNNWIDVSGPGIWEMTQEECNLQAKQILSEALTKKENIERLFFVKPKEENEYYSIFYYNRDRLVYDWWFIFRRINEKNNKKDIT